MHDFHLLHTEGQHFSITSFDLLRLSRNEWKEWFTVSLDPDRTNKAFGFGRSNKIPFYNKLLTVLRRRFFGKFTIWKMAR